MQTTCFHPTNVQTPQRISFKRSTAFAATPVAVTTRRSRQSLVVRADRDRGSGFTSGFILGGAIFGALGFIFAPQISNAILGENKKLRIPRFLDEENKGKLTKEDLRESIAQLNTLMDEFSAQLEEDNTNKDGAVKQTVRT